MPQQQINGSIDIYDADASVSVFASGAWPRNPRNADGPTAQGTDDPHVGYFTPLLCVNAIPATLSATNIALAQVPVAATPLTLTAGTGVTLSGSRYYLDGVPATNPTTDITKTLARNVRFTSAGNDTGGTATIAGFDLYGVAMTEAVSLGSGVVSGKKAFKSISSITPSGTLSGSNLSAGTGDVFGFPIRSDFWGDQFVFWNAGLITATTGYLAGVTTTATSTTGDVRGTYAVQSASDATKRLQMYVTPKSYSDGAILFGVTQA